MYVIPAAVRHSMDTGSGVHTVHCSGYAMGNAGFFTGIKRPRIEADDTPLSSVEDKSAQIMAYCLIKHKDIFPLTNHLTDSTTSEFACVANTQETD